MEKKTRKSNLELFRIVMMILIVSHHFVVNSGISEHFDYQNITGNMVFLQLFGFAGKAMINGFILITGYFMVKSQFSFDKLVKLYIQIKLYSLLIYVILAIFGFQDLGIKTLITTVFSIAYGAGVGFTGTFFVLYLLIPFINKFVFSINKIQFIVFISIAIVYFTVLSTFLFNDTFDEIAWYFVVYLIGAYIRLYPIKLFEHKKITGISTVILFVLCYLSILFIDVFNKEFNMAISPYHFVNNAHKILAILLAISMFCFFKNINIKSSKFINTVSSATFGVLLIHSNSASMIKYLWYDLLNVKGHYSNDLLFVYAIGCVLAIYIVCMLIDLCRIKFIEKPLFNKLHQNSKYVAFCKKIDVILNLDTI